MEMVTRTERGWAGHFICANRCLFRRNTLLEYGERRVVVSTVGNMIAFDGSQKREEIGCGRYYETMAFMAQFIEPYWEADVTQEVSFVSPWMVFECEQESDLEANAMHEAVVAEISEMLRLGTLEVDSDK